MTYAWIHSDNQTPALGSGHRLVSVHPASRKRVRLRPATDPLANGQLVTRAVYHAILKEELPV